MKIAEIFHSIQGEGRLVGMPSAFIRTSGCNLRCSWCDTPYASWQPRGEECSINEVVARVTRLPTRYVVLTGGEPMIDAGVAELTHRLRAAGLHITIETAATVHHDVACDLASISPKLSNSTPHEREGGRYAEVHDRARINVGVIQRFMDDFDHQLKFVVERERDLEEIEALLDRLTGVQPEHVLLMPQGVTRAELEARAPWVADACRRRGFRYCPRLHIELYGNTPGT